MEESPTLDCGATEKEHTKEMVRSFNKGFEFFSLFFFPHEFVILTLSPEHDSLMQTSEQHVIFHSLVRKPTTSGDSLCIFLLCRSVFLLIFFSCWITRGLSKNFSVSI